MRGHDEIIRMRLAGYVPSMVFWQDGDDDGFWKKTYFTKPTKYVNPETGHRHLVTESKEAPASLDLRFLVNLSVVCSTDGGEARARKIVESVRMVQPEQIIAMAGHFQGDRYITDSAVVFKKGGEVECHSF